MRVKQKYNDGRALLKLETTEAIFSVLKAICRRKMKDTINNFTICYVALHFLETVKT